MTILRAVFAFVALLALQATGASAQRAATSATAPDTACAYRTCALGIVPTWNGLAIVRGQAGPHVANLSFFLPRDVSAALAGPDPLIFGADSAAAEAARALRLRRIGATLTDAGIVLAGVAITSALAAGRFRTVDGVVAGVGAASLGISVPFQFAADGALSRAVWWHNARLAK